MLDVYLRENRNYVQGTQLIARAAEYIGESGWQLDNAQFSKITDRLVSVSEDAVDPTDSFGRISFRRGRLLRLLHLTNTSQPAPHLDKPLQISVRRRGTIENGANYQYTGGYCFEDLLNALTQAIKLEHDFHFAQPADIWLTGLRNLDIPVDVFSPSGNGLICIAKSRVMAAGQTRQSLWSASITTAEGSKYDGFVTFVCKLAEHA